METGVQGQIDNPGRPGCPTIDTGEPTDDQLVRLAQAGDERAFDALYTRYHREVRAFITARVNGDMTTADDITSDVFTKVFRFLDRFQRGSFRGWIYQIARNTLIDHYRSERAVSSLDCELDLASDEPAPDAQAIAAAASRQLLAALDILSPIPRRILELRLKGYPLDDICTDLNMELSAVKSAQHRAFKKLRAHLHEQSAGPRPDRRNQP